MKLMKLTLPRGTTGFTDDTGKWICTGSQMGRRNSLPDDINASIKLQMEPLKWVDGDYDQQGCYWGGGSGDYIYCAHAETVMIFVRAKNREAAKTGVLAVLPAAKFYR